MERNTMTMDRAFTAPKIMKRACLRTVCVKRIGMCNPPFYVIFWASSYSNLVVASEGITEMWFLFSYKKLLK